ncbi:recombination mediator RecR [Porphyromonas cangingivalis]|uniref:Recombination protein RecR n=1 Tax=Porphyromonas cangingivalis TaxID=36874 RepID=A0A0A2EM62_PORCN|nr:recombination mediator RecR [Porphyromonas cangingivalis]KGN78772.1 recombinase RecR [Porphyromonas cangingivalis]SJZ37056.1 DNA replication and repair protein RecR [Porphyromonas cangingivalis]VEJ03420.1 Recombination protein RecR [Porphyromonas cangingivalis]
MKIEDYSLLLQRAVDAFASLPGIGPKSGLRLALHLLKQEPSFTHGFCDDIRSYIDGIRHCRVCHNICDQDVCQVCSDPRRDESMICVVESVREVIAIERTGNFKGLYHVLGGIISPLDGIGPSDLYLQDLPERVRREGVKEVLLALSTTMEGDTTNFYIYRMLKDTGVKISVISRGVSIGDELEYADELTLGRSIDHRIDFESTLKHL